MEKLFSMESIAFQSSAFFQDLVQACEKIRLDTKAYAGPEFFALPAVVEITKIIQSYTGLKVVWEPGYANEGPLLLTPIYTLNHVFFSTANRTEREPYLDPAEFIKRMDKPLYTGSIDLEHAKVTGDFCEITQRLAAPMAFMQVGYWMNQVYTCEEVAAVILHEVGHAFIELEFLDRVSTTNQVLAGLSASLNDQDVERKQYAYSTAKQRLKLTAEQAKALEEAQNDDSLTVIMATLAVEKSRSELGDSIFDMTACEHLADQFSARHGAAKPLITAVSKMSEHRPVKGYGWRFARDASLYSLVGLILLPVTLLVLFSVHLYEDHYGSLRTRTLRLRGEIITRLKEREISKAERDELLEALKTADKIIGDESPKMTFFETVAAFVNSKYRRNYDYRLLQQKLESYANNSLFGQAARLAAL